MESGNPYDPPQSGSLDGGDHLPGFVGTIISRFRFTPQHLVETLARFRSQHLGRRIWRWIRVMVASFFVLIAMISFFALAPGFAVPAMLLACAILLFFPHKIDNYLARRSFRKSPHYNVAQVIYLSDEGFRSESEIGQTNLKWTAFSRAVIFKDGVLLFHGPKMVNWIPDTTLDGDDGPLRIRRLLAAKLPTKSV